MWNTPASAHSWNRRCTAEPLPNCRGSAFHWHPVFRRYTMPASARRSSNRDRPPRACDRGSGNQGSTYFHTSSGTSANLASIPSRDHAALRLATFQQVRGGALRVGPFRVYYAVNDVEVVVLVVKIQKKERKTTKETL